MSGAADVPYFTRIGQKPIKLDYLDVGIAPQLTTSAGFYAGLSARAAQLGAPSIRALGAAKIGATKANGAPMCWLGKIQDFSTPVTVCNVTWHGQWQCVMFPYQPNGPVTMAVSATGPTGLPAAFAPFDWQAFYFTQSDWRCIGGTGRLGPLGTANVLVSGPMGGKWPISNTWAGPLGGFYFNLQLKRAGQLVAQSGLGATAPPTGYLSGAVLVTENQAIIGSCIAPF